MKKLLFIAAIFLTTQAIAQEVKTEAKTSTITEIKMVAYNRAPNTNINIAYFIDGEYTPQPLMMETDPKNIERIEVKKTIICINNIEFVGQVYIYTKNFNRSIVKK